MNGEFLSIGEFSKLANTNIKCLRYYDRLGILKPLLVSESGYRYYSSSQIIIVDAIQICIDVGIPLKQFHNYYNEKNGELRYDKLFDDAEQLAEVKYTQIKKRLAKLSRMQNEINRCADVLRARVSIVCRIPEMNLWLEPYKSCDSKSELLLYFYHKLSDMKYLGITTGYDTGRLIISKGGKDVLYIYMAINVEDNTERLPENIIRIPPADYLCRTAVQGDIFRYDKIFPNLCGKDKIIIESELFTPRYDTECPKYGLLCLPAGKDSIV